MKRLIEELNQLSDAFSEEIERADSPSKKVRIIRAFFTEDELDEILARFYKAQKFSFETVDLLGLNVKNLLEIVASHVKMEYVDLDTQDVNYKLGERANSKQLFQYKAMPFKEDEINVYVAMANPYDFEAIDKLSHIYSRQLIKPCIAEPKQVERYVKKLELNESIKDVVADIRRALSNQDPSQAQSETSGIVRLIEMILQTCISSRASDIHVEPTENNCVVRGRIDGVLTEIFIFEQDIYPPLASRLKIFASMDIAERRKPQDGRFSATVDGREYDFRISTLPILNGESIVMRILDKSKIQVELKSLGMTTKTYGDIENALNSPYGILLVTGPTGSGKTTTLYAALNKMKSVERKIITVEDPVEYQLNLIQQVHVNEKVGLSFAAALRSILRQDPDIIMIGEIRDAETLRIAIQSALTGHLVFSTLHTNDAVSAIPRMLDMGIESYLISGSVVAIEAQRLVRALCPHCKAPTTPPESLLEQLEQHLPENYQFYKPTGCTRCSQMGYRGREMISEILPVSEKIQGMIASMQPKELIKEVAYEEGFIDMFTDGMLRAARGTTSVEEIYRVAKDG